MKGIQCNDTPLQLKNNEKLYDLKNIIVFKSGKVKKMEKYIAFVWYNTKVKNNVIYILKKKNHKGQNRLLIITC